MHDEKKTTTKTEEVKDQPKETKAETKDEKTEVKEETKTIPSAEAEPESGITDPVAARKEIDKSMGLDDVAAPLVEVDGDYIHRQKLIDELQEWVDKCETPSGSRNTEGISEVIAALRDHII